MIVQIRAEEGAPQFDGGIYDMRVSSINQDPSRLYHEPSSLLISLRTSSRTITIPVVLPSGEVILDCGNAYPLTIDLPCPLEPVDVLLSLDETYDNILMDGPDVYIADTTGLLPFPGVDCVITGSADGVFNDINTEPLTGSLTIDDRRMSSPRQEGHVILS